jgi:hypothetical protein
MPMSGEASGDPLSDEATPDRSVAATGSEPASALGRCLTSGQLLALQAMAPGEMPAESAAHLASCERCQRQALFGAPTAARRAQEAPSLGKAFLRVALVLVALIMFLVSMRMLLG